MTKFSTIQLNKNTIEKLKKAKPSETQAGTGDKLEKMEKVSI